MGSPLFPWHRTVEPNLTSGAATAWSSKPPALFPGAMCQGTFKEKANGDIQLFHVAWTFDSTGVLNGHWEESQTNTVSAVRKRYAGPTTQSSTI